MPRTPNVISKKRQEIYIKMKEMKSLGLKAKTPEEKADFQKQIEICRRALRNLGTRSTDQWAAGWR
jgi:hypothetical protein